MGTALNGVLRADAVEELVRLLSGDRGGDHGDAGETPSRARATHRVPQCGGDGARGTDRVFGPGQQPVIRDAGHGGGEAEGNWGAYDVDDGTNGRLCPLFDAGHGSRVTGVRVRHWSTYASSMGFEMPEVQSQRFAERNEADARPLDVPPVAICGVSTSG
ncbi:hypothetical protein GCM10012287_23530 [Streptomyces daqingensis]|uniref:Uncharacterized protein n=1 Tax=Streptomyces daqingensis TaxID=1472640 RepID=A0ABQ2M970_9ACTN|nr:hypothetical protein GCM10012287_23530 [Streptomyces daqingensis]